MITRSKSSITLDTQDIVNACKDFIGYWQERVGKEDALNEMKCIQVHVATSGKLTSLNNPGATSVDEVYITLDYESDPGFEGPLVECIPLWVREQNENGRTFPRYPLDSKL